MAAFNLLKTSSILTFTKVKGQLVLDRVAINIGKEQFCNRFRWTRKGNRIQSKVTCGVWTGNHCIVCPCTVLLNEAYVLRSVPEHIHLFRNLVQYGAQIMGQDLHDIAKHALLTCDF